MCILYDESFYDFLFCCCVTETDFELMTLTKLFTSKAKFKCHALDVNIREVINALLAGTAKEFENSTYAFVDGFRFLRHSL